MVIPGVDPIVATAKNQERLKKLTKQTSCSIKREDASLLQIMENHATMGTREAVVWIYRNAGTVLYLPVSFTRHSDPANRANVVIQVWVTVPMACYMVRKGLAFMATKDNYKDVITASDISYGCAPKREILEWEELVMYYEVMVTRRAVWSATDDLSTTICPMAVHDSFQYMYKDCVANGWDMLEIAPPTRMLVLNDKNEEVKVASAEGADEDVQGNKVAIGQLFSRWDWIGPSLKLQTMLSALCTANPVEHEPEKRFTKRQMEFITLMIAVCGSKTFGQQGQKEAVAKARSSAFAFSLAAYECMPDELNKFMNIDSIDKIHPLLATFPDMRVSIFRTFLQGDTPAIMAVKPLLAHHQLSIFNMIHMFFNQCHPTQAHFHKLVVVEAKQWLAVMSKLKENYEDDWKYVKLLQPTETETATSNWPNLAHVAMVYCKTIAGHNTIANIRNTKVNKGFNVAQLLATPVDEKFLDAEAAAKSGLGQMTDELAELYGILLDEMRDAGSKAWFKEVDKDMATTYQQAHDSLQ